MITKTRAAEHSKPHQPVDVSRMQGLSLVELMVALVISMLIMIGLVQIFSANRVTYQADEGVARLQENARFALEFLSRELRLAGNMGCMSAQETDISHKVVDITTGGGYAADFTRAIAGFNAVGPTAGGAYTLPALYPPALTTATNPALTAGLLAGVAGIVTGSDVLVTNAMSEDGVPMVGPNFDDGTTMHVAKPSPVKDGQTAIVSNCQFTLVFNARVTPGGAGVTYDSVSHPVAAGNLCEIRSETGGEPCYRSSDTNQFRFRESGTIGTLRTAVFYVGQGTYGGPSLFRRTFVTGGIALDEELVEGIETMQVLYGMDLDSTPATVDQYVTAEAVADWQRVQSVRIGLLVATSNVIGSQTRGGADSAPDTQAYAMQNINFNVNPDQRRRRVFDTTIYIRNRH